MASPTVDAFNATLKGFLEELVECCPDAPGIGKVSLFLATYDSVVKAQPRMAMEAFVDAMGPHAALITAKNPKLFKVATLPGNVSLKEGWAELSATTKAAVWQYIQMLYLLATTASSVPPEMLSAIENVASTYADKIQSGQMDLSAVTGMLLNGGLDLGTFKP